METNIVRNYNEITDSSSSIKPTTKYMEKTMAIKIEQDKDACHRFLTINNNSSMLCHKYYTDEYINSTIEYCDYLIYFTPVGEVHNVIAFALVKSKNKKKGKILDILLACAAPNKSKFGNMIAHSLYNFAVKNKYAFLYVSPRTAALRQTFIKYGFESIHGRENVDEVLEKEIDLDVPIFNMRTVSRKIKRLPWRPLYKLEN